MFKSGIQNSHESKRRSKADKKTAALHVLFQGEHNSHCLPFYWRRHRSSQIHSFGTNVYGQASSSSDAVGRVDRLHWCQCSWGDDSPDQQCHRCGTYRDE